MEEALEAFDIALHHILIAGDSFGIGKEDAEHAADVIDHQRDPGVTRRIKQTLRQLVGQLGEGFMYARLRHFA